MSLLQSFRVCAGLVSALGMLSGCAGTAQQPPLALQSVSSVAFKRNAATVRMAPAKSWMLPGSQKTPLLYVSNWGNGNVTVYTYLNGGGLLLVGTLTGFSFPAGLCTDTAGNVWIPDYNTGTIYEYQHGGTKPIEVISHQSGFPYACAVDPATGNLAVAKQHPYGHYRSYSVVDIYPKASKKGQPYDPYGGFREVYFVAYDNASNLYADGTPCISDCYYGGGGRPGLYELPKGGSEFTQLTLSGATLYKPTAINWVKPTLLLGDQNFQNQGTNGAYKLFVSGSTATVVGTLPFKGTQETYGFWRRAGNVIVPDYNANVLRIYSLSNGSLISTLSTKLSLPFGAAVSQ